MNKDGTVGDSKFNDTWAKNIEKSLAELLPKMLANNPERIHTWLSCMSKLRSIFKDLRRRKYFTDTQIDQLKIKIDKWSKQWLEIATRAGFTNYIHMMSAGHLSYYLQRYRNLYCFSKQGWEFHNKQASHFMIPEYDFSVSRH
jgi:hypothetical protein